MQTPSAAAWTASPGRAPISTPSLWPSLKRCTMAPRSGQRKLTCGGLAGDSSADAEPGASEMNIRTARPSLANRASVMAQTLVLQRLDNRVGHLLGVAEQHHGVVAEEELVFDAGVARAHAALD